MNNIIEMEDDSLILTLLQKKVINFLSMIISSNQDFVICNTLVLCVPDVVAGWCLRSGQMKLWFRLVEKTDLKSLQVDVLVLNLKWYVKDADSRQETVPWWVIDKMQISRSI